MSGLSLLVAALAAFAADSAATPASRDTVAAGAHADSLVTPTAGTASADTTSRRVVRRFQPVIVRARFVDPLSYQTVHETGRGQLRSLPIDDWQQTVALQPGVVATGDVLHVRGGRAGESRATLDGLDAGEPFRGRPIDPPLLALTSVALEPGPFDARYPGATAGTVAMRTLDPPERPETEASWTTDAGLDTHYDRLAARAGAPLPWTGWGIVGAADLKLDDTALPALRTPLREDVLGLSLGPRAASDLLSWLKLGRSGDRGRGWIEALGAHTRTEPYDPMWTLDGWVGSDSATGSPRFSPDSVAGWQRYKAADHLSIEDDRRVSLDAGWSWLGRDRLLTWSTGWSRDLDVISLDGSRDRTRVTNSYDPIFGYGAAVGSSPFLVYGGDDPYQRERDATRFETRLDGERRWTSGAELRAGAALTYDHVSLWELDRSFSLPGVVDSLRSFEAWAPGGSGYLEGRWPYQGMLAQGGLRVQAFTAGPQADRQSIPGSGHALVTVSPRFGIAFPISDRDVLSFVYAHLRQDPDRDFLYDNRLAPNNGRPLGDPNLVPPTTIHYEVALKHVVSERWAIQAGVFQREAFDQIGVTLTDFGNGPVPVYANVDDAHAIGLETRIWCETAGTSRFSFAYTWTRAYGTASYEEGAPYGPQLAARLEPLGETPLDWDQRHTFQLEGWWRLPAGTSFTWITTAGSPLPWTPAERRTVATDPSLTNSRRLGWTENTLLAAGWTPHRTPAMTIGVEAHNLFNENTDDRVSVNGYPNPYINTYYDDYAAYRNETGRSGGGYWDDTEGGSKPGWVPVGDPRLKPAPRTIRFKVSGRW